MFQWKRKREAASESATADETPIDDRPDEAIAVDQLQKLCWLAELSAARVAADKLEGVDVPEWDEYEHRRYRKFRDEAITIADTLSDEFYRAAALEHLIELFMKAGDIDDAQKLFANLPVELFKKRAMEKYPQLTLRRASAELH
jgi:hypothetical protein